jgi:hypothetical protein
MAEVLLFTVSPERAITWILSTQSEDWALRRWHA